MGGANTSPKTGSSYPVVSAADAGLDPYFKSNPQVSGMAWGGGLNNSDPSIPRSVVLNPYSKLSPQESNSVIQNEKIRHQMDESKWSSDFEITPEQKIWSKQLGAYATNPQKLRETIVARLASNDYVPSPTNEQKQLANTFMGGANPTPQSPEANYARLEKQGMSDQGIVSLPELKKEVIGTAKELGSAIDKKIVQPIAAGTANFFGRDTSKTQVSEDAIESGLIDASK